jgi:predicted permease
MRMSLKLYRLLLKIYPAGFREDYGVPLQQQFKDDYREARSARDRVRLWAQAILDIVRTAPGQLTREIAQDARHALRIWRRRPLHTAFAIAVLAIAIGANTGVFSVLNALLLRSLPFRESDRLAMLHMFSPPRAEFHQWREQNPYLADAAMYNTHEVNVEGSHHTRRLRLSETSWNFFPLLGREPVLGRGFAAGEDLAGQDTLAVIGYGLWQQMYGGDRTAVGSTIRVNGTALTIVGIAPPGFDFPNTTDLWSPTTFDFGRIPKTATNFWYTIGRLRAGMTWTQARHAFETEAYQRDPERRSMDAANRPALIPLRDQLVRQTKTASIILMGGVALLLLLACANIANLLLARTVARSNELLIKAALGASRGRLLQQMLTETVLLSIVATAIGLFVAYWTTALAAAVQPVSLSSQTYTILDWRVLAFTIALAIITGLIFGAGPALYANRLDFAAARSMTPTRGSRTRNVLVATQIAITIVLLTGSIALGRAFVTLLDIDNGFDVQSIASMSISLTGTGYEGEARRAYYQDVMRRVREVPGVTAASATESLPLHVDTFSGFAFQLDHAGPKSTLTHLARIAPDFCKAIRCAVIAGREFTDEDLGSNERVAVVSDEFARQFGESAAAVGRHLTAERWPSIRIIGVTKGVRPYGPAHSPQPTVYLPSRAPDELTLVIAVAGAARDRIGVIREAVQAVDPRVPVFNIRTMDERLDAVLARPRFYTTTLIFFGGLALLLAVIGLYGIVSYGVQQRTREMGIRLALGTTPGRLRGAVLRQTFSIIAAGAVAGALLTALFGRYLQSLVHGALSSADTVALSVALLALTATCAVWSATRHIARLDIAAVLRVDSAE